METISFFESKEVREQVFSDKVLALALKCYEYSKMDNRKYFNLDRIIFNDSEAEAFAKILKSAGVKTFTISHEALGLFKMVNVFIKNGYSIAGVCNLNPLEYALKLELVG